MVVYLYDQTDHDLDPKKRDGYSLKFRKMCSLENGLCMLGDLRKKIDKWSRKITTNVKNITLQNKG